MRIETIFLVGWVLLGGTGANSHEQRDLMELEIKACGDFRNDEDAGGVCGDHWDLRGLISGRNYSEGADLVFSQMLEQHSLSLLPPAAVILQSETASALAGGRAPFVMSAHWYAY